MKKKIIIKVEWLEEDGVYLATSDELTGLVIEKESLEDCCGLARHFAYDMIGEYQPEPEKNITLDFDIRDKRG